MENLFALFEIEERIKLKPKIVLEKYYQLSKQYHPDHNQTASTNQEDHIKLLEKSSSVNRAKDIFLSQDKTIDYILSYRHQGTTSLPADFLMEMMDFNESIEEAKSTNNIKKIASLQQQVDDMIEDIKTTFAPYIDNYHIGMNNQEACLKKLNEYRLKKKYLERIKTSLQLTNSSD